MRPPRDVLVFVMAIGLFLIGCPGVSEAQLVLFDAFSVTKIDPAKWFGVEQTPGGAAAPNTEAIRKISVGQLNLLLTSFGGTGSDSGTSAGGRLELRLRNPGPVTAMQAKVTVRAPIAQGCPASITSTRARAHILAFFFNDGTSPGPGDATGNVFATIQKVKDSQLGNRIQAAFGRCNNDACVSSTTLGSHTFASTWATGIADTLRVQWDAPANQFLFAVNPGTPSEETAALPYTVAAENPLVRFDVKGLRASNDVANCTAGQKKASISAFFDDVMVNP